MLSGSILTIAKSSYNKILYLLLNSFVAILGDLSLKILLCSNPKLYSTVNSTTWKSRHFSGNQRELVKLGQAGRLANFILKMQSDTVTKMCSLHATISYNSMNLFPSTATFVCMVLKLKVLSSFFKFSYSRYAPHRISVLTSNYVLH